MGLSVVGKSIPRVDGLEKVTGKAKYVSDFRMPGMLFARILRSPYAHARIVRIDTSEAEKLLGVRAVVTGKDSPDVRTGSLLADQYILPRDNIVRCIGQAVAAVAAETVEIAEDALELIQVEYEELPAVFDPEESMKKDPPAIIHPELAQYSCADVHFEKRLEPDMPNVCRHFKVRQGDVARGFQDADFIVENRFSTARIQNCPLETHQVCAWVESDGTLTVVTAPRSPGLGAIFSVPSSKVRVITPYVGGAFGSKGTAFSTIEPIALLLALKTGRPVKLAITREEHFVDGRQLPDFIIYVKDGVKRDGTLVARQVKMIINCGRHSDLTMVIVNSSSMGAVSTYRVPNFKLDSYGVYTNMPVSGPLRGFGCPEVHWAIEQQMDILAEKLGMGPAEFRKKNILREGEKDVCGETIHSIGVQECLDKVAEAIEWGKKSEGQDPWRRGKGIAIGNKFSTAGTTSVAMVKVHPDGTIGVRHGAQEVGQGINTVVAQIAAEEFGVPVELVKVVRGDSSFCPYDYGAVASRATFHTGEAVRRACQDAKKQIAERASNKVEVAPSNLTVKGGRVYFAGNSLMKISELFSYEGVPLGGGEILGVGSRHVDHMPEDPETGQSERIMAFYTYCAHAVEVAVNMETGEIRVLSIVGAFDIGRAINPKLVEGQIEGGFGQGIGGAIYEQIILEQGQVTNQNFGDYKIPTIMELPLGTSAQPIIVESAPHKDGPFGAKGVGEATLVSIAAAIANAVYDATGVRIKERPINREKMFDALKKVKNLKGPLAGKWKGDYSLGEEAR